MKTLLLLRHAKSSWADPDQNDHDRPLKKRGIKAAGRIGRLIANVGLIPDLVLCSTAVRTRQTLDLVLKTSGVTPVIQFTEELYHCSANQFFAILAQVDEQRSTVLVVGHNPGLEEFLSKLTGTTERVPTGTLVHLDLDLDHWEMLTTHHTGKIRILWRPRELDSD